MLIANNHIRRHYQHIKLKVGGIVLQEKEKIKILGVTISNNLSWEAHTSNLIRNVKYCYRSFSRSCKYLTMDSRKLLYNASIASRLNYCDMIWDGCSVDIKNKLQTIQNRCARRILNKPPGTSAAPLLHELGWLKLDQKRLLHRCVFMHKLLIGNGPNALIERLHPYKNKTNKVTRGNTNNNFMLPYHRTNYIAKSFIYDTAKCYNEIPHNLKELKSSNSFKERLHKHLLNA